MSRNNDNTSLGEVDAAFRQALSGVLVPLLTVRTVDPMALQEVEAAALALVRRCQGEPLLPKDLLREMLSALEILRNEATPFATPTRQLLEQAASHMEHCYRMILADEIPEDRRPGVPRIL